jgi:hypothetical protein
VQKHLVGLFGNGRLGVEFSLSFRLGGEIVAGDGEWLRKLEDLQEKSLTEKSQGDEISASHSKILRDGSPKLWERVKSKIEHTIESSKLRGVRFLVKPLGADSLRVLVSFTSLPPRQGETLDIQFLADPYRVEASDVGEKHSSVSLFFTVSNGRIEIRDSADIPLPDDEEHDLAEVGCQRLLEPFVRAYLQLRGD